MNRQEYIRRLQIELISLPKEEMANILVYYNEYFDEAGLENEQEVIKELGHPVKVANQIKADYAVRQLDSETRQGKRKRISAVWWVVLGVLASPVAFPLALVCGILAFTLFVTVWAVAFALLVSAGALVAAGVMLIVVGISVIAVDFASAILVIGAGLVITGVMLLIGTLIFMGTKVIVNELAKAINNRRNKSAAKKEVKWGSKNEE